MNERIQELAVQSGLKVESWMTNPPKPFQILGSAEEAEKFAELIMKDMHKKVIASILITDVTMEEKGQVPTSEDYIRAINKHFGVE